MILANEKNGLQWWGQTLGESNAGLIKMKTPVFLLLCPVGGLVPIPTRALG
jgi:hypothetical protein